MKKIILCLAIVFCISAVFTGCDKLGEKYWEDTANACELVFGVNKENAPNNKNFNEAYNIEFNENLTTIMSAGYGTQHAELTNVFAPLFNSAIYYAKNYYADFKIIPKNNNKALKSAIKNVNENIDEFEDDLEDFIEEKQEYEFWLNKGVQENGIEAYATSGQENARLIQFKREYIELINSAYNLSASLFNARKVGYYTFANYGDEKLVLNDATNDVTLAINATNLEIIENAITIVSEYNANKMATEYEVYWSEATDFYNNVLVPYKNGKLTIKNDAKTNLYNWKNMYDMFVKEQEQLKNVLSKFSVKKLSEYGNNAEEFAQKTNNVQNGVYAEYYLNFYKKVQLLKSYTSNLFA